MSFLGYAPSSSPMVPEQIKGIGDQLYRRIDGSNVPADLFKNLLINPSMDWWQRGTAAGPNFVADRWFTYLSGTGTLTSQQYVLSPGEAPTASRYALRIKQVSRSGGVSSLGQGIELGTSRTAGKRVVFTALVRSSAPMSAGLYLEQYLGTGGSAGPSTPAGTMSADTTWKRIQIGPVALPSIAGKVLGPNDVLYARFYFGNTDFQLDMTDVELKEVSDGYGDQVPPFERVPVDIDGLRCMRFYERSHKTGGVNLNTGDTVGVGHPTGQLRLGVRFRVTKAISPTVTVYDHFGASGKISVFSDQWYGGNTLTVFGGNTTTGFYVGHNIGGTSETQFAYEAHAEI